MSYGVTYALPIYRGLPYRQAILLTDDAGAAMDLTGCSFDGVIARLDGTGIAPIAVAVTNLATGEVTLDVDAADTALLTGTLYTYKVFMTDALGFKAPIMKGRVEVETVPAMP